MRQNVIIVLLSVIATLLAVSVFSPSPVVVGQNASGTAVVGNDIVGATGSLQGGSGSAFWLYNAKDRKLAVYVLGNMGLELRSVRDLQWDFRAIDLNIPAGKPTKVSDIKKDISKQQKPAEKE
jgi:hypothetical protein